MVPETRRCWANLALHRANMTGRMANSGACLIVAGRLGPPIDRCGPDPRPRCAGRASRVVPWRLVKRRQGRGSRTGCVPPVCPRAAGRRCAGSGVICRGYRRRADWHFLLGLWATCNAPSHVPGLGTTPIRVARRSPLALSRACRPPRRRAQQQGTCWSSARRPGRQCLQPRAFGRDRLSPQGPDYNITFRPARVGFQRPALTL